MGMETIQQKCKFSLKPTKTLPIKIHWYDHAILAQHIKSTYAEKIFQQL